MMFGNTSVATGGAFVPSRAHPIDLTGDDDDSDGDIVEQPWQPSVAAGPSYSRPVGQPGAHGPSGAFPAYHAQTSSSSSASSSASHQQQPPHPMQAFGRQPSFQTTLPPITRSSHAQPQPQYPASGAHHHPHPQHPQHTHQHQHHPPTPPQLPRSYSASGRGSIHSNLHPTVIDLTSAPTPPPLLPAPPPMMSAQGNLPPDLALKTPVCIGQLQVTALVLYPIAYLNPSDHGGPDAEWATVRTQYVHDPKKPAAAQETVQIRSPNWRNHLGENIAGENFGVVEQKVATALGPMLGKGLIRVEARVRRGRPNLPILPLILLVYTPKGNIQVVGNFLREQGLLLDHPELPADVQRISQCFYFNPHNPPPGGHARAKDASGGGVGGRPGYAGVGPGGPSRWSAPTVSGKSVEVQRNQADELFKHLQTGEELAETEAAPEVKTRLYPHQKKAVTFLLERERERAGAGGAHSSLWQAKPHPFAQRTTWTHLVTGKDSADEPAEAKGAILADDMGLGKTITTVALIASTLSSAYAFAAAPLPAVPPPPRRGADASLTAAHFAGQVWGMPDPGAPGVLSAKELNKANREADRLEAEYARACRLKVRSRGTLIVCPLSTISNWEDQFREHWSGAVTVVGGTGITSTAAASAAPGPGTLHRKNSSGLCSMGPLTQSLLATEAAPDPQAASSSALPTAAATAAAAPNGPRPCRVYVYHGNSRRPDPAFLADFDAVITTYATLATEFSKQARSAADDDESSVGDMIEVDELGNQVARPAPAKKGVKRKKCASGADAPSPLQSVCWFRVVLDEAHSIKETGTVACRACCDLEADRRLCLTGTPVQNKLDDLFALIKFLRLEPFTDKAIWTEYIGTPVKFGQAIGIARLQTIMKTITLRRTKESRTENGQKILALPERVDELRLLKFGPEEQAIYDQYFQESKSEFTELSRKNEIMKNYVGILQKILRLRQICDHYELVKDKGAGVAQSWDDLVAAITQEGLTPERAAAVFAILRESASAQCTECGVDLGGAPAEALGGAPAAADECAPPTAKRGRKSKAVATRPNSPAPCRPILTRCQHLFCPGCFRTAVFPEWPHAPADTRRQCAACPAALGVGDAVEVSPEAAPADAPAKKKGAKKERRQKGVVAAETFVASTKIKALMGDLIASSRANPHSANYDPGSLEIQATDQDGVIEPPIKTIVFSQWTTMLDKIEDALELASIRYERLDGTMRREERVHAMDTLKADPACEILLVSLKAGGVGLNLTSASRVYLMDPYWNPAVEHQAVDRVHRLGQTRKVFTHKLVIENTIEDRLLKVQERKEALANMTLGPVMSKAEVVQRRLEELMQLFDS